MANPTTKPSIEEIWRTYDSIEQRLSAPLSARMLDLGKVNPGMKVLDVATGRGEPAIPAAHRVLPDGHVLGLDADSSVLEIARERARNEGVHNLELVVSDLASIDGIPEQYFDLAIARWGLMYFQEPVRSLQVVRRALANSGRLVAAVWTDPDSAVFFQLPRAALSGIVAAPAVSHQQPSTFYYAELSKFSSDLETAGFSVQYSEVLKVDVMEVSSEEELIAWGRTFGMWDVLNTLSLAEQAAWERNLVHLAKQYRTSNGTIRIGGSSLIVVAA